MPPKLTQPLRPVGRYRPGKAPVPVADSDSDDDEDYAQQQHSGEPNQHDADEHLVEFSAASSSRSKAAPPTQGSINVALRQVEVHDGRVRVGGRDESGRTQMESSEGEYETDSDDEPATAPPKPVFRPSGAAPGAAAAEESSEYDTDSEEEEPVKPLYKPVFVSKRNRDTVAAQKKELDPEVLEAQQAAEAERRRQEAKSLVADSIVRELAEKEAQVVHPDVDDTDGLNPEGEFEAWKLRELQRLKRDREERYALEKIREEVEARRALPEELRLKEDTERAEQSRKEKKKGQQAFLQRYHHRGVFHTDSADVAALLAKHDYSAPTESTVTDVASLPAVMQKRNFGKAHQTKYTHLAAEDTSRPSGGGGGGGFGRSGGGPAGTGQGSGCFLCGGPHLKRDCPQLQDPNSTSTGPARTGANAAGAHGAAPGEADLGWAARGAAASLRRPPGDGDGDRGGGGSGSGRRSGLGYDGGRGEGRYSDRDRERDRGDRYAPASAPRRENRRSRSRSRSRSPPPRRPRYDDDHRAGHGDRDWTRRRSSTRDRGNSRSRERPPRERDGGGGKEARGGAGWDPREGRKEESRREARRGGDERDEKRRRLD